MTNPTSNFGWQMPTPTDLVTDLPADFEVFGQAVDTSMADLKGGTTGQILSKATNADMDFTWIANDQGDITAVNVTAPITGGGTSGAVTIGVSAASTAAAGVVQLSDSTSTTSSVLASTPTATKSAYDLANTANTAAGTAQTTANAAIPKSTVTTAGDVIYATGSSAVTRLGIGTAGQVLKVNAGATAPEWGAAAGGSTVKVYQVSPSATTTLSTTTLTDISGYSVTFTPTSGTNNIIIFGQISADSTVGDVDRLAIDVDGTSYTLQDREQPSGSANYGTMLYARIANLSAASHTVKLRGRSSGGALTTYYGTSSGYVGVGITVIEVY